MLEKDFKQISISPKVYACKLIKTGEKLIITHVAYTQKVPMYSLIVQRKTDENTIGIVRDVGSVFNENILNNKVIELISIQ